MINNKDEEVNRADMIDFDIKQNIDDIKAYRCIISHYNQLIKEKSFHTKELLNILTEENLIDSDNVSSSAKEALSEDGIKSLRKYLSEEWIKRYVSSLRYDN